MRCKSGWWRQCNRQPDWLLYTKTARKAKKAMIGRGLVGHEWQRTWRHCYFFKHYWTKCNTSSLNHISRLVNQMAILIVLNRRPSFTTFPRLHIITMATHTNWWHHQLLSITSSKWRWVGFSNAMDADFVRFHSRITCGDRTLHWPHEHIQTL